MIGIKYAWKRLKNYAMKIKYSLHQCFDSLDQKLNPNHSIHKQDANPSVKNLQAAPEDKRKVWVFAKKFQNWKLHSSAIQRQITILLRSWGFKERVWIKIINSNAQNWYTELEIFHILFIFVFQFSSIPIAFFLWIHTNWLILKLTVYFNWVFVQNWRIHHWSILGFQRPWIGVSQLWKN